MFIQWSGMPCPSLSGVAGLVFAGGKVDRSVYTNSHLSQSLFHFIDYWTLCELHLQIFGILFLPAVHMAIPILVSASMTCNNRHRCDGMGGSLSPSALSAALLLPVNKSENDV